jgi:hypothetical protein
MSLTNPNQIQRAELHLAVQVLQKPELINYNHYYKLDKTLLIDMETNINKLRLINCLLYINRAASMFNDRCNH